MVLKMFSIRRGEKIFKGIHLAMLILFLLLSIYIITLNPDKVYPIAICCIIYLALSFFHHFYLANVKQNILHWILPYLEGLVLFILNIIDSTTATLALYMLHTMDIAIDYNYGYGLIFTIIAYIAYMTDYIQSYLYLSIPSRVLAFFIAAFQFFLYMGLAFLARKYSHQSRQLQDTTNELHAKMIAMEQMTLLKERNRIAGEIHNTVGHQLTTALVQIEATQMLIDKDPEDVKRRLEIIKVQLRDGLNEIRRSIHAISAEQEYENFDETITKLIGQVRNHAGIEIVCHMDNIQEINLRIKKSLYHFIMESITNAIRHGHCKRIKIELLRSQYTILLSSFNDGVIPKKINNGYGINNLRENLKKLGGSLAVKLNKDGWFGIVAELPINTDEGGSYEEN